MYRTGKKQHGDTFSAPSHRGASEKASKTGCLGFACTEGNKWCHTVEWMCLFSTILPDIYGNVVKRQFLVELEILFSLFLSLSLSRHPLFSFFSRLGVFFLQKAAHFDLEEKKKEKRRDPVTSGRNALKPYPRCALKQFIL